MVGQQRVRIRRRTPVTRAVRNPTNDKPVTRKCPLPNQACETSFPNCFLLIYVRRAGGTNSRRLCRIISVHCAARAAYGKLPLPFNMFGVRGLHSQAEIVLRATAFGPARSACLHFASGRSENPRSTFVLGVGKWVFGQIVLPYTRFVRARIRRWKRAHFAGQGHLPKTRLNVKGLDGIARQGYRCR
jgi:hypothetical protein